MPTTTTHAKFKQEVAPAAGENVSIYRTFTDAVFVTDGDILKVAALKRGVRIVEFWVKITDYDTGATPALAWRAHVTDGTTTKIIIASTTSGQSAAFVRAGGTTAAEPGHGFCTTNNNFRIELEVLTSAQVGASTGTIEVCAILSGHRDGGELTE